MFKPKSKSQQGSILIFTVLMLGGIMAIVLSMSTIAGPKVRTVVNAGSGSINALYAAESIIEWCIYTNRGNPALPQPAMSNGASYTLTPAGCSASPTTNQAIGTYQGVSRSLQMETLE
ncbi:MAG: hypothetical protein A3C88_01710 [Candidatus Yanofskybacteria bacterium RIFCSPHIGHO2_02_FULL_50_12]|uniref:Type 4 fimbrial biogenesis protein PilX N-terminal domain-containing protein n=1 Tax=Candidatus Yanofskybacteria bacterium RIFCSPHIGHO2_02_FULL_50_12 TaxID=1802685 RepID=A0A1F8FTU7_9BACT|nr:MAG: hypothetical protein A3C88_01710 [Candidatus Yanofskybacteria bacterium RIFCSPHIGHO2_02_FULL_50_12]